MIDDFLKVIVPSFENDLNRAACPSLGGTTPFWLGAPQGRRPRVQMGLLFTSQCKENACFMTGVWEVGSASDG